MTSIAEEPSCVMAPACELTLSDPAVMSPKLTPPLVERVRFPMTPALGTLGRRP